MKCSISLDTPSDQTEVLTLSQHPGDLGESHSLGLRELYSKFPSLFYSGFPSIAIVFQQLKVIKKTEDFGL